MRGYLLLALALMPGMLGCPPDSPKDDSGGAVQDDDGDGYGVNVDCDDANAAIHPGATELCNGVDDDCDTYVDAYAQDASLWYADADGDGYGDDGSLLASCEQPSGTVGSGGDCDDTTVAVAPGTDETCNDIDDDCDGTVDEDPIDGQRYFYDIDGDGYGDPDYAVTRCSQPSGTTLDASDCDDRQADDHPGAEELFGDGRDNDCDGDIDEIPRWEGSTAIRSAAVRIEGEDAYDNSGMDVSGDQDLNLDGYTDLVIGGYGDDEGGTDAGAVWVFYGPVTDVTRLGAADVKLRGASAYDNAFINAMTPDITGDGVPDLLVGAYNADYSSGSTWGAFYVVPGPVTSSGGLNRYITRYGDSTYYAAGYAVAAAGDVNGDGQADILSGAPHSLGYYAYGGAAFVEYGPITRTAALSSSQAIFHGPSEWSYVGMWKTLAGLGDMDGDGYDDIGIGAQSAARYLGQVFVVTGPAYGSYLLGADFYHITGDTKYSYLGASVAGPGDVNGDGYDDLLVGAPWGDSGKAYVFLGPPSRWDGTTASASLTLAGSSTSQGVGTLVSKADDLDGDGFADIMVLSGNVYASGGESCSSTVGIVYGPRAGAVDFEASDALITGTSADCGALVPVSGGDNNGDFAPDILIGAPQQSSAGAYSGTTYLFLGGGL